MSVRPKVEGMGQEAPGRTRISFRPVQCLSPALLTTYASPSMGVLTPAVSWSQMRGMFCTYAFHKGAVFTYPVLAVQQSQRHMHTSTYTREEK